MSLVDVLRYTFVVLEVVACCCGAWLRFIVLTFSSFLLSVSHRFSWWLWLCHLSSSVRVHFLVLSTADTDYWRRPRRGFLLLYQATFCKTCDSSSQSLAWSWLSITRPRTCRRMSPIIDLMYYFLGFRRSARLRKLTREGLTGYVDGNTISVGAKRLRLRGSRCPGQGSLMKEIYVVRGTSMSQGTVHFFPVQYEV